MTTRILRGHVLDRLAELPDESVHCCVTSPPYFGLRSYGTEAQVWGSDSECEHTWGEPISARPRTNGGGAASTLTTSTPFAAAARQSHDGKASAFCRHCNAWDGDLGLEPSPELYIAHLVEVFREVRRVLRKDGTLWLNIGDSYSSGSRSYPQVAQTLTGPANPEEGSRRVPANIPGIKPKDLLGIPWMLAFALRADGWWLRSEIIWAKKAPMPESVTDRPTCAHEKIFLLTKSARYFYDAIAVQDDAESDHPSGNGFKRDPRLTYSDANGPRGNDEQWDKVGGKRNMRNWWLLGPEPFPEAHFATFPTEIPRICIKAGTSERGVCPKCGAPWERVRKETKSWREDAETNVQSYMAGSGNRTARSSNGGMSTSEHETIGWRPTCSCQHYVAASAMFEVPPPVTATVLDPFLGAGTTALVADQLGRDCIGIELNTEYAQMAERRVRDDAGMFAQVGE